MSLFDDETPSPEPTTVHRVPWAERYAAIERLFGQPGQQEPARHPDKPELLCIGVQFKGERGDDYSGDVFTFETAVITAKYGVPGDPEVRGTGS